MMYTDDPLADFDRWDKAQNEAAKKLPVCEECNQPIHDDYYFDDINGLDVVCEDCLIANHRKVVGDYIE